MAIQTRAFDYVLPADPLKQVVRDGEAFERAIREIKASKVRILDYETTGLKWYKNAHSVGIGLAIPLENRIKCWYFPYRHRDTTQQLSFERVQPAFKELLEDETALRIAHHMKYDRHIAKVDGITINGPVYCTMIAASIYNENEKAALKVRAVTDLGEKDAATWESHINFHIARLAKQYGCNLTEYKERFGYSEVPISVAGPYACYDLDYCGRLWLLYELKHKLSQRYARVTKTEMELVKVLGDIEQRGQAINVEYLEGLSETLQGKLGDIEMDVRKSFSEMPNSFDLSNDDQLRNLLVERLRLPLYERTKSGTKLSVARHVLEEFSEMDPRLLKLCDWREANKISTTYTNSILSHLDSQDFVHCTFNSTGAATGRTSCNAPNLQNIANDSDKRAQKATGKKLKDGGKDPWSVKRAFYIKETGYCRVYIDYSQIELRVAASYSKDPIMVQAYLDDADIHARTAQEVFGTAEESARKKAKMINFGLSYGLTPDGFARRAKIPLEEAQAFYARFEQSYSGLVQFRARFWEHLRRNDGYFVNRWRRPRRVPNINSRDMFLRGRAERQSFGSLIQGTAAELTKESLVRIHRLLRKLGLQDVVYVTSTIHDEIQIDTPIELVNYIVPIILRAMCKYPELDPVPVRAGCKITKTVWPETEELELEAA